jgi:site-specific DNA-methyltransferase (adenine-specific)
LAFGGSRTYHRLGVAIEDAGFEIRDTIAWISNKTFPKSLNVSKAIDKKLGAGREVVGSYTVGGNALTPTKDKGGTFGVGSPNSPSGKLYVTTAGSPEGKQWEGWGTGLKQVVEPVVMARKPLDGTVAENTLLWGVGGINIDASRIATSDSFGGGAKATSGFVNGYSHDGWVAGSDQGRWPANVILDEVTATLVDEASGQTIGRVGAKQTTDFRFMGESKGKQHLIQGATDIGGASRFFYVARASKRDRNDGVEIANTHPTVKPTALMRYLIKLVTPPGGIVLDPFTGSGSTGKAALLDGFQFVGIELTEEYLPIIEGRLKWANERVDEDDTLF